jgi:hypothetical protein
VFFLNGIGLDLDGFQDAIEALDLPWALAKHSYRHGYHVALTVPGFEDEAALDLSPDGGRLLTMDDQGRRVATFIRTFLAGHPVPAVILYGFSYGSDLAVEVLAHLAPEVPLVRVVLTELNVDPQSCFITSRITDSFSAAKGLGPVRHREAYKGFVSRVVKAGAEGRISNSLMQDMALYFRTIARKNWDQMAQSAEEASAAPERRVNRLLAMAARLPGTALELVFSDPHDLQVMRERLGTWDGPPGRVRIFDSTAHEHFHHMGRAGVLENLGGWVREALP